MYLNTRSVIVIDVELLLQWILVALGLGATLFFYAQTLLTPPASQPKGFVLQEDLHLIEEVVVTAPSQV